MTDKSTLGDRMKQQYEAATRFQLPRRTYTIIRVDGRAFHSLLRSVDKPFDHIFIELMDEVTRALCKETGAAFGYVQSDEVSLLLTDFATTQTEAWFGGVVQKMASIAAGTATAVFNWHLPGVIPRGFRVPPTARPVFDGRVFTIPEPVEVANYFIWRQRDCTRNSVSMAARANFSQRELHGKNSGQMQDMLWTEHGVNWNDYPVGVKRGRTCVRVTEMREEEARTSWVVEGAPIFTAQPGDWLAERIPALPVL